MAYSKYYERNPKKKPPWPDLRYSVATGECKLFNKPEDVPNGWVKRQCATQVVKAALHYDRDKLTAQLLAKGVTIDPRWGTAHMKKVLDDLSPSR